MAPRGRPTRLNPDATPTPVTPAPNVPTTTTVTEAQGVAAAMAEAEASRVRNGYNSNEEIDKIEKYIGGLPNMILGSVKASKSKTMQEVIEFTTKLMEDKTQAYAERQAERKRKYDDLSKNNQNQQNNRQNTGQAYTAVTARGLAMRPRTVESGLPITTTTTTTTTTIIRRATVAMSAELKVTLKEIAED
ncbi:hypothetical protein Tco_0125522 [Tanacetum coccineum]